MTDATTSASDRDSAISRLKSKRAFTAAVASYLIANVFFWGLFLLTGGNDGGGGVPWPLWITGFGALGLVGQAWSVYGQKPIRESDIEREMQRNA